MAEFILLFKQKGSCSLNFQSSWWGKIKSRFGRSFFLLCMELGHSVMENIPAISPHKPNNSRYFSDKSPVFILMPQNPSPSLPPHIFERHRRQNHAEFRGRMAPMQGDAPEQLWRLLSVWQRHGPDDVVRTSASAITRSRQCFKSKNKPLS